MSNAQNLSATYPSRPHVYLFHQSTLLLSLFLPIHSNLTLSLYQSHGGAPSPPPPLKPYLAGASPEDADELHHLGFIFFLGEELPQ